MFSCKSKYCQIRKTNNNSAKGHIHGETDEFRYRSNSLIQTDVSQKRRLGDLVSRIDPKRKIKAIIP